MDAKIINFPQNREPKNRDPKKLKNASRSGTQPPDRTTILLQNLAGQLDELIRFSVVHDKLAVEEVAAILAHRLGTFLKISEKPEALLEFCAKIIEKQAHSGSSDTTAI